MKQALAKLNHARISPQKIRLVTDVIRGHSLVRAQVELDMVAKKGAPMLKKLLQSAVANAKNGGMDEAKLFVKELYVNEGPTLKRSMPRAHGRAAPIRKRTSHVTLILGEKE